MVNQTEMMSGLYMQQYLKYMQLQALINSSSTAYNGNNSEILKREYSEDELQEPKKTPYLSFGIDTILSDSFGPKRELLTSPIGSSRSASPNSNGQSESFSDVESIQSNSTGMKKPKKFAISRGRTIYTEEQLEALEAKFSMNQYIVGDDRVILADELGLNVKQIKIWFQNRRIKQRRRQTNRKNSISESD